MKQECKLMKNISNLNQSQNDQELTSQIIEITPGYPGELFKIFGYQKFSYQSAYGQSTKDWSGFYTQFSPEHSLRYLTKKWGDGSQYACLIKIFINTSFKPMKLIKVCHSLLSKHSVSGQEKAKIVKSHLRQKYGFSFGKQDQKPLIQQMGKQRILIQCVDREDQQLIIPHDLLNEENFVFEGIACFKRSNDKMLRTICWRPYNQEQNWRSIKGQQQFEPYLLLNSCEQLKYLIKNSRFMGTN